MSDFFLNGLTNMLWSENHLVKSLLKMITAAGSKDLKKALTDHLEATKVHVQRLEQVFEILEENVLAK